MQTIDIQPVAFQGAQARQAFIKKTYTNLMSAIACFTLLEIAFFKTGMVVDIIRFMQGNMFIAMIGFIGVSMVANHLAYAARTKVVQYLGLYGFVLVEALFFAPILLMAEQRAPGVIESAAGITLLCFGALTAYVLISKKDFSFLGTILFWAGIMSMGFIFASMIFGFQLGILYSVGMVAFAGGCILYETSTIVNKYPEDAYVGAALSLFSSIALMFIYILRILLLSRD